MLFPRFARFASTVSVLTAEPLTQKFFSDLFAKCFAVNGITPEFVDYSKKDPATLDRIKESCLRNKFVLKAPSVGASTNFNHQIREALGLHTVVVHAKNYLNEETEKEKDLDFFIVRQNTEGEYSQIEYEFAEGVRGSVKLTTVDNVVKSGLVAVDVINKNNRKSVTTVHKANILKLTDGLFLKTANSLFKEKGIDCSSVIVDNFAMQLVTNPKQFDVVFLPNLYGNIAINVASGIIGCQILSGVNIGEGVVLFEPAVRHDHYGADQKLIAIVKAVADFLTFVDKKETSEKLISALKDSVGGNFRFDQSRFINLL